MRFLPTILSAAVAAGVLAACFGSASTPTASLPGAGAQSRIGPGTTPSNVYVADKGSSEVTVYNHAFVYQRMITIGVSAPDFVTFDSGENLYVANSKSNTVTKYSPGGSNPILVLQGKSISDPTAVAVDSSFNIYIASTGNDSVRIYDQNAMLIQTLGAKQFVGKPRALAFDKNGYLYVTR